tara:strand:+ start:411 stop:842 length:432 start_codon:yes stop_codon:yes gene_type:complete
MSLSNNEMIVKEIVGCLKNTGEQLEAENTITWDELADIRSVFAEELIQRLANGAKKYNKEVPIFKHEDEDRNNLSESIEEVYDALIYSIATRLRLAEFDDNQIKSESRTQINRGIAHLCYAFYYLKKVDNIINNTQTTEIGGK